MIRFICFHPYGKTYYYGRLGKTSFERFYKSHWILRCLAKRSELKRIPLRTVGTDSRNCAAWAASIGNQKTSNEPRKSCSDDKFVVTRRVNESVGCHLSGTTGLSARTEPFEALEGYQVVMKVNLYESSVFSTAFTCVASTIARVVFCWLMLSLLGRFPSSYVALVFASMPQSSSNICQLLNRACCFMTYISSQWRTS